MNNFDLLKQRGGQLLASLVVAISMVGCASLDAQPSLEYQTADTNCPACGAPPEQACKCRPDSLLGGYKPTTWTTYDEPNVVHRQLAHAPPTKQPERQMSETSSRALAAQSPQQQSSAALLAAQPVVTTSLETRSAQPVNTQPEQTLVQQTARSVDLLEDEFALLVSDESALANASPLHKTPMHVEPSTLQEALAAAAAPMELATPVRANPLSNIQLVTYDEELPSELLLEGSSPVPAFSTASVHTTIHEVHDGCPTCRDCGLKGRLGDFSWLRRHRCAAAPRDWCYRVKHWRPMFFERLVSGTLGCAGGSCGSCTDCGPAHGGFKSMPAVPPQPIAETHFIAHGEGFVADCDTCGPTAQCATCVPGANLLGKLRTSMQHRPVLGAVFGHSHGHGCAGPPNAACYGYHATHWRQMGEECNIPHGHGHPMMHGPLDVYPSPVAPEEVERPQPSSPLELPPELTPPTERTPAQPTQPTPPSQVPDLFPDETAPMPTEPAPTQPAAPRQRQPVPPVPQAPEVTPDEIPDLFPQRSPSEQPQEMVKFNTRWRPATSQPRSEPNLQPQPEPQQLEEETALQPIRRTSATQLPGERRELRFVPSKWMVPVVSAKHDESLDSQE